MAIKIIIEYKDQRQMIELMNKSYTIGRSRSADIILPDSLVSGKHIEITLVKFQELYVKDLESTNGTYVNGSKINSQKLFIGDQLILGKTTIHLDPSSMTKKEYNEFYNNERTSIRFIDAGLKTGSIQRNIYDEEEKSKSKSINLNFSDTNSKGAIPKEDVKSSEKAKVPTPPKSNPIPATKEDSQGVEGENQYELNEKTRVDREEERKTKIISLAPTLDKPAKNIKTTKPQQSTSKKQLREKEKEKNKSVFSKLLGIFKKD